VRVFSRRGRDGVARGVLETHHQRLTAQRTRVSVRLSRRASAHLLGHGILDPRAREGARVTGRDLLSVTVRRTARPRTAIGSGDGWHALRPLAHAAGNGMTLAIENTLPSPVSVSTIPFNCMFDNGDDGSELSQLGGTLAPTASNAAYVEADGNRFDWGGPQEQTAALAAWSQAAPSGSPIPAIAGQVQGLVDAFVATTQGVFVPDGELRCSWTPSVFGVAAYDAAGNWVFELFELDSGSLTRYGVLTGGAAAPAFTVANSGSSFTIAVGAGPSTDGPLSLQPVDQSGGGCLRRPRGAGASPRCAI
jgi:hypothetical protein